MKNLFNKFCNCKNLMIIFYIAGFASCLVIAKLFCVQEGQGGREVFINTELYHCEDRDGTSRHIQCNISTGSMATAGYTAYTDTIDNRVTMGIAGKNYATVGLVGSNDGVLVTISEGGELLIGNAYAQPIRFGINPLNDGDIANIVCVTCIDSSGNFKVQGNNFSGILGEVRTFALSVSSSITKTTLQENGWAICDGTTPDSQGISSATITSTPDLRNRFIRCSDDETSGTTGGSDTHTLTIDEMPAHTHDIETSVAAGTVNRIRQGDGYTDTVQTASTGGGNAHNNMPAYYELAYFIKVKGEL